MREQTQHEEGAGAGTGRDGSRTSSRDAYGFSPGMLEYGSSMTGERGDGSGANTSDPDSSSITAAHVSVVIPCLNEERFIGKVLENLAGQYRSECYEIIVVDGRSVDGTREVVSEFRTRNPQVRVHLIDNPARNIPAALNLGIKEAQGDVIVRMDAHTVPPLNYVRRCVELLSRSEVVGMPWRISPGTQTQTARAIALAVAHPFGIGDAKYRLPDSASTQFVDTVPFGVFRKSLWQELGGFNENLLANEDYDFNYRVRRQGGRVLLDTSDHCVYFARTSMKDLAAQYFRYGSWKAQMVKLHPRSIRLRQTVAPAFVASIIILAVLGLWWTPSLWMLLLILSVYIVLSITVSSYLAKRNGDLRLIPAISTAFLIIHSAWGGGFLLGLARTPRR